MSLEDAGTIAPVKHIHQSRRNYMLDWVLTFFIIALVAGVLGFGGLAGEMAGIAKILFLVFLVLFAISFLKNRGRAPSI